MRSYRYTACGPPKALCAYMWVSAAHASPSPARGRVGRPGAMTPASSTILSLGAVGRVEVISPPRAPGASVTCSQPVGGATGTSLPVRVRVRRGGEGSLTRASAGPGGQVLPLVPGSRTEPKLACLIPSPSSGPPERADTLPDSIPEPQRSGLRCPRFRSRGGACGGGCALRGRGRGVRLRSPRSLTAVWAPSPGPAAFSHTSALGEPPRPWSSRLPGLGLQA